MSEQALEKLRAREEVVRIVEREASRILDVLEALYRDPELSGQEVRSARLLMDVLVAEGFEVESGSGGLPTAFAARRVGKGVQRPHAGTGTGAAAGAGRVGSTGAGVGGTGTGTETGAGARSAAAPVRVGFLAEYDALPGLGHACGHNLIAAAAIGAGIAVGRLVDLLGGEILVFGTPAEETIGGKVILAGRGVFDGLDAAMMVHPGSEHRVFTNSLACRSVQVEFHGKPAHAVAHPDKGINALDAMIQLFIVADHIRRSSRRDVRIPGVILEGGVRPNVVPERAVAQFSIRAPTSPERDEVVARMRRWVESIALASGCSFAFQFTDNPYDEMITNRTLAEIYKGHLASEGVATRDEPREHMGSLDMGNVSFRVPAIHPYVAIVPPDVASHTQVFALATVTQTGKQAALLAAKTLGRTAVDLLCDSGLVARVREEFAAMRAAAKTTRGEGFDAPRDYILDRP